MPLMPPHRCHSCGTLVVGRCPCRPAWTPSMPTARVRGRRLQRMRSRLFATQPLCVLCKEAGQVTVATIRDHTVPLAEGGRDDESNEQPLCHAHHDAKTQDEARRGRLRADGK